MSEIEIARDVALLSADGKTGYPALRRLVEASKASDEVFPHLDEFLAMLEHKSAYVRVRGFTLIAYNARWDKGGCIDGRLERLLTPVTDEKPIAARQCIQALAALIPWKVHLLPQIKARLETAQTDQYPDSMRPLVQKDLLAALALIDETIKRQE